MAGADRGRADGEVRAQARALLARHAVSAERLAQAEEALQARLRAVGDGEGDGPRDVQGDAEPFLRFPIALLTEPPRPAAPLELAVKIYPHPLSHRIARPLPHPSPMNQ